MIVFMKALPPKLLIPSLFVLVLSTVGFVVWQTSTSADGVPTPVYELVLLEKLSDSEQTVYTIQLAQDGQIIASEANDDVQWLSTKSDQPSDAQVEDWTTAILAQTQPLSGPREFKRVPNTSNSTIFVMTGEADNYLNLYLLDDTRSIRQLTDSIQILPAETFILSSSVEFIAWRPAHPDQFLYRVRVRDAAGTDHNELYLYNLQTHQIIRMPYFGKDPVWSPDGMSIIGARFNAKIELYELYLANIETENSTYLDNGCNPRISADGLWLAYDEHISSHYQNYVDCFTSGEIKIMDLATQKSHLVTQNLNGHTQILGWRK